MKMDKSNIAAFFMAVGGLISVIAAFMYAIYAKRENDSSSKKILDEQKTQAEKSIKQIAERTDTILNEMSFQFTEFNKVSQEKYKSTLENLDELNSNINDSKNRLSRQVKSLANPLRPFKATIRFKLNYKNVQPDLKVLISDLGNYFEQFPDYSDIWRKHPEFILHYKHEKTSGPVNVICNKSLNYKQDYGEGDKLGIIQGRFLNAFMPLISLHFNSNKYTITPDMQSDLDFKLVPSPHDTHAPAIIYYRIDLIDESIFFQLEIDEPEVIDDNGKVKSLNDCEEGELALLFRHTIGETIELKNAHIHLGPLYNIWKGLNFKTRRNNFDLQDDHSRTFFYLEGKKLPL